MWDCAFSPGSPPPVFSREEYSHFIVFGKTGSPQGDKNAGTHPADEMGVKRAGTPETFLGKRSPLAAGSEHRALKDVKSLQ
jgi:hypothetical protein